MPAKSRSQVRAMHAKARRGEISAATLSHFQPKGKAYHALPERVKKKKAKKARKKKRAGVGFN